MEQHQKYLSQDNSIDSRNYNEQQYKEFLSAHKGEYKTVLWSGKNEDGQGGANFTRDICEQHNAGLNENEKPWMTNEMLLEEAGMLDANGQLNGIPEYTNGENRMQDVEVGHCWDTASSATCDNATGECHAIIGVNGKENSVLNNTEREACARNNEIDNVDVITNDRNAIDSETGKFDLAKATHADYSHDDLPITSPQNKEYSNDEDKTNGQDQSETQDQNQDYYNGIGY